MSITLLDGILVIIMLISAVLAMIRGFSREVLSIISWVVAAVGAATFYKSLSPTVSSTIPVASNPLVADAISAAAIGDYVTLTDYKVLNKIAQKDELGDWLLPVNT